MADTGDARAGPGETPTFKVVLLGEVNVGKTSLFQRLRLNRFQEWGTTAGVDQTEKVFDVNGTAVKVRVKQPKLVTRLVGLFLRPSTQAFRPPVIAPCTCRSAYHTNQAHSRTLEGSLLLLNGALTACSIIPVVSLSLDRQITRGWALTIWANHWLQRVLRPSGCNLHLSVQ